MKARLSIICICTTILCRAVLFHPSVIFAQDASAPVLAGQRSLGSSANDEFRGMHLTDDGGCIVAGYATASNGDVSSSLGQGDFWIVKLDSTFAIQWQQVLGGSNKDWARDVKPAADGGYVVLGYTSSSNGHVTGNHGAFDFWLVKLDEDGLMQWQKTMGGSHEDNGYTVEQTADGGYICSGYSFSSNGDVTGHHGMDDGWVVKLNASHDIQWQRSLGGSLSDQIDHVILTADGGYLLVGYTASVNGDVTFNHGGLDLWVVKLNSNGNLQWQKTYGGTKGDTGREGIQTADGGFIIVGFSTSKNGDVTTNNGGSDFWIIKINSMGTLEWQRSLGSSRNDYAYNIEASSDGNFLVSGFSGNNDGDAIGNHGDLDAWLVKMDTLGNMLWQKNLGGSLEDAARACGEQRDGSILVSGFTQSNNGDVSGHHGGYDGWVVRVCTSSQFYQDNDQDGYGNIAIVTTACSAPTGYVTDHSDCNDLNPAIHPQAPEVCDGIDDNCDGAADEGIIPDKIFYADQDLDGYGGLQDTIVPCFAPDGYVAGSTDCDDNNPAIHPDAAESCNTIDDNCDGEIDESVQQIFFADEDDDGYGDAGTTIFSCIIQSGFVSDSTDCNDHDMNVHPGAFESCNSLDDNCNGQMDEGALSEFYKDADEDGFGNPSEIILACAALSGYVSDSTDCDDGNSFVYPFQLETCNNTDDNCNGEIDENVQFIFYADTDSDGFGSKTDSVTGCSVPLNYALNNLDCNDADSLINPSGIEACNGLDDDCNGQVDEGTLLTWFIDADGDGFGNLDLSVEACSLPDGYVSNNTDCDDTIATVNPNATEICNDVDDNCNGLIDQDGVCDSDGDGFSVAEGDCNDQNNTINPGSIDTCDDIDNNCNGEIDENAFQAGIAASGDTSFCIPASVLLTVSPSEDGYQFTWYKDGGLITDATGSDYTAASSGTYSAEISNGICFSITDSIVVTAYAIPSVTVSPAGAISICKDTKITLTASGDITSSYQWYKDGVLKSGATNATFTTSKTESGTYKVKATDGHGCSAFSDSTSITRINNPNAAITPLGSLDICTTGSIKLQANSGIGFTYSWFKGTIIISGATKKTYTATASGDYTVKVTNSSGCSKTSTVTTVFSSCRESGEKLLSRELKLYPNPASSIIHLFIRTGRQEEIQIRLCNLLGQPLQSFKIIADADGTLVDLPLESLKAEGIYYLVVGAHDERMVRSFVHINQ